MRDKELKLINEYMARARLSFCCDGIGDKFNPDSNSAWECVQEMERKDELDWFITFVIDDEKEVCFPYLMNPKNFFNCFAKWLEGGTPKAPENSHFEGTKNDPST